MTKAKELQNQICELDKSLELIETQYADYKITVNEFMRRYNEVMDQQAALTSEVAKLRLEDFKRGEV